VSECERVNVCACESVCMSVLESERVCKRVCDCASE
jgi:hypothetical protein